jgi:hypothetical protein
MSVEIKPIASPRQRRRYLLLGVGLVVLVVIAVTGVVLRSPVVWHPVPDPSKIKSMEATFYDPDSEGKVTFTVAQSHWPAILDSLLPAKADSNPAKWVSLGTVEMKLADGGSFQISLYSLDSDPGAFSSGPDWEHRRYYRGGSTAKMQRRRPARSVHLFADGANRA